MIFLTFFVGLLANFIGYIPPGNINLTVVQLTLNRGIRQSYYFIAAFCSVELVLTFLIVRGAQWLARTVNMKIYIDWVMLILFFTLGTITWMSRNKKPETNYSENDSIKLGLLLGVMNPNQIPFWGVTGTYLIAHNWIKTGGFGLFILSLGSAVGAAICLLAYARTSHYISRKFTFSASTVTKGIALLFFGLGIYQLVVLGLIYFKR